ncbi:VanZ family protein [Bacillus spongiae]|uniref:VanZ family protein n=1 Tax=Bacillus spongiae TaxID=2683610 RepID=A0ABU8HBH7_9BACI
MVTLWNLFGNLVPIFSLIVFGTFLFLYRWKKNNRHLRWREVLPFVLTTLSVIGISLVTLTPQEGHIGWKNYNFMPLDNLFLNIKYHGDLWVPIRNLMANIVLFIPFGFAVGWLMQGLRYISRRTLFIGASLSLMIEALQWNLPLGRSIDIDDWLMNSIGAWVGGVLFVMSWKLYQLLKRNRKR